MKEISLFKVVLAILLLMAAMYGAVIWYDHNSYPNYHRVKIGMTKSEVNKIVERAGSDDYPHESGGCVSYYFCSDPKILVVTFDKDRKVIGKSRSR